MGRRSGAIAMLFLDSVGKVQKQALKTVLTKRGGQIVRTGGRGGQIVFCCMRFKRGV